MLDVAGLAAGALAGIGGGGTAWLDATGFVCWQAVPAATAKSRKTKATEFRIESMIATLAEPFTTAKSRDFAVPAGRPKLPDGLDFPW